MGKVFKRLQVISNDPNTGAGSQTTYCGRALDLNQNLLSWKVSDETTDAKMCYQQCLCLTYKQKKSWQLRLTGVFIFSVPGGQ